MRRRKWMRCSSCASWYRSTYQGKQPHCRSCLRSPWLCEASQEERGNSIGDISVTLDVLPSDVLYTLIPHAICALGAARDDDENPEFWVPTCWLSWMPHHSRWRPRRLKFVSLSLVSKSMHAAVSSFLHTLSQLPGASKAATIIQRRARQYISMLQFERAAMFRRVQDEDREADFRRRSQAHYRDGLEVREW